MGNTELTKVKTYILTITKYYMDGISHECSVQSAGRQKEALHGTFPIKNSPCALMTHSHTAIRIQRIVLHHHIVETT